MTSYWQTLTQREKLLVSSAGILVLVTAVYMLVARPLAAYHAESERAYSNALSQYQAVRSYADQLAAAGDQAMARPADQQRVSLRVAVSSSARAADVEISRLQPSEDGALTIWAEQVQAQKLFLWLDTLAKTHGIGPQNILIQKTSTPGALRVQLQFSGVSG